MDNGTFEQWTSIVLDRERLASGGWTTGRAVAVVHCSKREGRSPTATAQRGAFGRRPTSVDGGGQVRRGASLLVFVFPQPKQKDDRPLCEKLPMLVFESGINQRAGRK